MSEIVLDVKGLLCPLPVLKANRALQTLEKGDSLRILATDRSTIKEFQEFCRQTGHALIAFSDQGTALSFLIKRK
ncbi:Sulfur carrier protein TusA (tRNA thiolation [Commensalibacter communis]|uniref:Molybdenum cofactor biosynthesis (TusA (PDB:1DCJ (PUBMED:23894086 n=1 Tax=Commensalibacter communis TaxID=2972786 RepID=A0A9W4TLX6_9PROT|nr:sulfurtransferase TusA family protein [Commensalibacter communis]CAI3925382.1 Sulfur carrier protein TusA (tRNA thiolation [Commensalibacter communis]CAI3926903.1 Sulfur carrier protein TusA (tRNA thiolation [Commensalibacter communis]CAI3926906.1 Sulfur carrier protein TusA (tRNA thiolation [Commensalibacter communis]CAI3927121.1 Sulfur carrier protein TusA (tRNA thiolation [Commensalibacter communis]CAI3927769.1 Sulfur carrier protein TusA (tRNA thiolation [Commensalibacter communis]